MLSIGSLNNSSKGLKGSSPGGIIRSSESDSVFLSLISYSSLREALISPYIFRNMLIISSLRCNRSVGIHLNSVVVNDCAGAGAGAGAGSIKRGIKSIIYTRPVVTGYSTIAGCSTIAGYFLRRPLGRL